MDWLDEVRAKLKRKNQVLFAKGGEYLRDLTALFREQSHRTIVLWFCSRSSRVRSCKNSASFANKT